MHASDLTRVDASAGARTPTTRVPVPTRVGAWRYALALHACVLAACAHPAPAYPASSAPLEALVPDGTQTLVVLEVAELRHTPELDGALEAVLGDDDRATLEAFLRVPLARI